MIRELYLTPWLYVVAIIVFALERVIPVRRDQPTVSAGLLQDFVWFNADTAFQLLVLPLYLGFLATVYRQHLSFLTLDVLQERSIPVRIVCSLVIVDFLQWLHHLIRHRVEAFWAFHMVHHSQRELNLFTDGRFHVMEYVIDQALIFIPMLMLQVTLAPAMWLALAIRWYTRIYHANLRTHYGPLKYFMVTPQSHRIHHSVEAKHQNKNFGVLFTIWDRLFGTLYANYDEYPEVTGVADERFPVEQALRGWRRLGAYVEQTLYPFRRLVLGGLRDV